MTAFQRFLTYVGHPSTPRESASRQRTKLWTVLILSLWLTLVLITAARHEFCRDEVRALSLAREATSPLDLYRRTQYDGHPFLWFFLLYLLTNLFDTALVLPILSLVIALAAVAVFVLTAPFALWFKGLVIFSALPLYEYSVMARNYGISMLLMFLLATLYTQRDTYPIVMAALLALLANTNVHATILTVLLAGIWLWDSVIHRESGTVPRPIPTILALVIILAGIALSVLWTWPRPNTILTDVHHTLRIRALFRAFVRSIFQPREAFSKLMPPWAGWSVWILLPTAMLGLLIRPPLFLAALGAQAALGSFFQLAYWGEYRHQGLLLIFLLTLYGIALQGVDTGKLSRRSQILLTVGFAGLLILMAGNVVKAGTLIRQDIQRDMSAGKAFAEFLKSSPSYRDAIIVPEPDYLAEPLPYYVSNRLYLPREGRFGTTVSWTTAASSYMSLGQLLAAARDLEAQHHQPVLILYGHRARIRPMANKHLYSYNKAFTWTAQEAAVFKASTVLVADFKGAVNDETYEIYALR